MQPIKRSQLITVTLPAGTAVGAKIFFPDIPELRDALVDGLETYVNTELATDLQGNGIVTTTELSYLAVSLVQESDRRAMDFPAASLRASLYGGMFKEFTGWRLNWQKCYVQLVNGPIGANNLSFALNVFYHYASRR